MGNEFTFHVEAKLISQSSALTLKLLLFKLLDILSLPLTTASGTNLGFVEESTFQTAIFASPELAVHLLLHLHQVLHPLLFLGVFIQGPELPSTNPWSELNT